MVSLLSMVYSIIHSSTNQSTNPLLSTIPTSVITKQYQHLFELNWMWIVYNVCMVNVVYNIYGWVAWWHFIQNDVGNVIGGTKRYEQTKTEQFISL